MSLDPDMVNLRIHEAFGDLSYPGDDRIVSDNTGYDLESERIKNSLKGCHWRDVSYDTLDRLRGALSRMSPEGFRFYLPAYMIISISDPDRADVIVDNVISDLTRPHASDFDRLRERMDTLRIEEKVPSVDWNKVIEQIAPMYGSGQAERTFLGRASQFDVAQSNAIRQFLQYLQDTRGAEFPDREPEMAIKRHWHQFGLPID